MNAQANKGKRFEFINRLRAVSLSKIISITLVIIASVFAIVFLIHDGGKLLKQPIHLNLPLLGLSFVIGCSGLFIAVIVWNKILTSYGVNQLFRDDVRIYSYSSLALVLPGGIWGIVSRSVFYQRLGANKVHVAAASIVETIVVGIAAAGLYSAMTIVRPEISLWKRPEIGLLVVIAILTLIHPHVFNGLINWTLRRAHRKESLPIRGFGLKDLATWTIIETAVLLIGGLAMFVLLASLTPVSQVMLIPVIASWAIAVATGNLLFWLPGTPVLRDGTMILILTPSLTIPVAVAFVLLVRLWSLASLLLFAGLVWVTFDLPIRLRKKTNAKLSTPTRVEYPPDSEK